MQHGGGVVVGVHPAQGITDDGFSELALGVALAHSFIHRFIQIAVHQMDFLAQHEKHHSHSSILADGNLKLLGGGEIFL